MKHTPEPTESNVDCCFALDISTLFAWKERLAHALPKTAGIFCFVPLVSVTTPRVPILRNQRKCTTIADGKI